MIRLDEDELNVEQSNRSICFLFSGVSAQLIASNLTLITNKPEIQNPPFHGKNIEPPGTKNATHKDHNLSRKDVLKEIGWLQGYVHGGNDYIQKAKLSINGDEEITTTDIFGFFRIPLKEGSYEITVTAPGYSSVNKEILITSGKTTVNNFNLEKEN